jgi:lysophospholipase L1-like esterase
VKIMLAGDSITQGFNGDFTWRYRLWQGLVGQGIRFDFVGPRKYPHSRDAHHHYLVNGWDTDHDALGGTRLRSQLSSITADMTAYRPDVLVAFYGTNDELAGHTVPEIIADWRTYIAKARAVNPNLKIVLGEVMTRRAATRMQLDAALHVLAHDLNNTFPYLTSPVTVADLDSPDWVPAKDSYDGVHPTPTGETVIAQKAADALRDLGVLTTSPRIERAHVAWIAQFSAVSAVRRSHRVAVDWQATRRLNNAKQMRARIKNLDTGRTTLTRWTANTRLLTSRLKPGRYRISVQGRRAADMESIWGRSQIVRVR